MFTLVALHLAVRLVNFMHLFWTLLFIFKLTLLTMSYFLHSQGSLEKNPFSLFFSFSFVKNFKFNYVRIRLHSKFLASLLSTR